MDPNTDANLDGPAPLNCPKCGAPAVLPYDAGVVTLTCQYCNETFTIPQSIREAQERRLVNLRWLSSANSWSANIVGVVVGLTILGVLITLVVAYIGSRTTAVVTPPPDQEPPRVEPPPSITPPSTEPDETVTSGEARVKDLIATYASAGCNTVLLPATRIVGGRDIDAKFVANGPCVRLLAVSGTGDELELTLKTPKGKPVTTPAPASELDFMYCAKQAGLHPATIRSNSEHAFTVASIECPRSP